MKVLLALRKKNQEVIKLINFLLTNKCQHSDSRARSQSTKDKMKKITIAKEYAKGNPFGIK
jgi:hypothetical protein